MNQFDRIKRGHFTHWGAGTQILPGTVLEYAGHRTVLQGGINVPPDPKVAEMTVKLLKMQAALERISKESNNWERDVAMEALV